MDKTDQHLIRLAQQGDRQAFAGLYERYQPAIYNYLFYRIDDPDCAEELTGEVFVRMARGIRGYRGQGQPFLAWLYTIARNLRTDYYRDRDNGHFEALDERLSADETDPADLAEWSMTADCLKQALRFLTEEQQFVILAKFIEDRDNAEIAALMGKPEGAVKSLQHRALAALRRAIAKVGCYEHVG